jgi:hypothetical protein
VQFQEQPKQPSIIKLAKSMVGVDITGPLPLPGKILRQPAALTKTTITKQFPKVTLFRDQNINLLLQAAQLCQPSQAHILAFPHVQKHLC